MTNDWADLLAGMSNDDLARFVDDLPEHALTALADAAATTRATPPVGPLEQAINIDTGIRRRPHLDYLSERLTQAVTDVEAGMNRFLTVSMPPRMGKSVLSSTYLPVWVLSKHPDWRIAIVSYSPTLAAAWGRQVRRVVERYGPELGVELAKDAGAVSEWETTAGGGVISRSMPGQSLTGVGVRCMILDDPTKDFATAHSQVARDALWDWWTSNAFTRLEFPCLVAAVGTRWHMDDVLARLVSPEYAGDPDLWEQIVFPAIATSDDVLGRAPGEPLLSPIIDETPAEALTRWATIEAAVGSYAWAALYQQTPNPPGGAIFNVSDFRYWTSDPELADVHGAVLLTAADLARGDWVDSWDTSFKGNDDSDFVVGQRWVRLDRLKVLTDQVRGRWGFTNTLAAMRRWALPDGHGRYVHTRLVEDSANGPAIISSLRDELDGLRPWTARGSKESRYRAVTPDIERGEVLLPHPAEMGREWVTGLVGELREAPTGAHDDQCDALAQALLHYGGSDPGFVTVPTARVDRPGAEAQARAASMPRRPVPGVPSWSGLVHGVPSVYPASRRGGGRSPWAPR